MEQTNKIKRTRDVGFDNVKDPATKQLITRLVKCPPDATNFIFWYSKSNPNEWGLTLKAIPSKLEKEGFPSQHTWKITWSFKSDSNGERLAVANHCKSLGSDVVGDDYTNLKELYLKYREKN